MGAVLGDRRFDHCNLVASKIIRERFFSIRLLLAEVAVPMRF